MAKSNSLDSIKTKKLTKSFGWNNRESFQQHDIQECFCILLEAIEKVSKSNIMNEIFQGQYIS